MSMNSNRPARPLRHADTLFLRYLSRLDVDLDGLVEWRDFLKSIQAHPHVVRDADLRAGLRRALVLADLELAISTPLTIDEMDQKAIALSCWEEEVGISRLRLFFDWVAAEDALRVGMTNIHFSPLPPPGSDQP